MDEHEWLTERLEENRGHLRAVAQRMLGSLPNPPVRAVAMRAGEAESVRMTPRR
jgi:hypothetical protein